MISQNTAAHLTALGYTVITIVNLRVPTKPVHVLPPLLAEFGTGVNIDGINVNEAVKAAFEEGLAQGKAVKAASEEGPARAEAPSTPTSKTAPTPATKQIGFVALDSDREPIYGLFAASPQAVHDLIGPYTEDPANAKLPAVAFIASVYMQ